MHSPPLSAPAALSDTRSAIDRNLRRDIRFTGMDADADFEPANSLPILMLHRHLDLERAQQRIAALERREDAVSGAIPHNASMTLNEVVNDLVVPCDGILHLRGRTLPALGAAVDVREQISGGSPIHGFCV
jgi:hypothetical protein